MVFRLLSGMFAAAPMSNSGCESRILLGVRTIHLYAAQCFNFGHVNVPPSLTKARISNEQPPAGMQRREGSLCPYSYLRRS